MLIAQRAASLSSLYICSCSVASMQSFWSHFWMFPCNSIIWSPTPHPSPHRHRYVCNLLPLGAGLYAVQTVLWKVSAQWQNNSSKRYVGAECDPGSSSLRVYLLCVLYLSIYIPFPAFLHNTCVPLWHCTLPTILRSDWEPNLPRTWDPILAFKASQTTKSLTAFPPLTRNLPSRTFSRGLVEIRYIRTCHEYTSNLCLQRQYIVCNYMFASVL